MKNYELKITLKDWVGITFTGIAFSMLLTSLIYLLVELPMRDGLFLGIILGLVLSLFSFNLVSLTNNFILPSLKSRYLWWTVAFLSSSFAGVAGFQVAYILALNLPLEIPQRVRDHIFETSIIIGILNYLIGLLLFLFIRMRNSQVENHRKILELRLLSNLRMVESHFLSNLMNSIAELVYKSPQEAEKALIETARFLRLILNNEDLVTLEEELRLVDKYVNLQNIRYRNSIKVFKTIKDHQLLKVKVPKFSIQILVENAITHGYRGNELLINIEVVSNSRYVKIMVSNNGAPIQEFKQGKGIEFLNERLKILVEGRLVLVSYDPVSFLIKIPYSI